MSSKMDPGDLGKGAPLEKPKVEGGYRQRYRDPIREKKAGHNKASKSDLQWFD